MKVWSFFSYDTDHPSGHSIESLDVTNRLLGQLLANNKHGDLVESPTLGTGEKSGTEIYNV